MVLHPPFFSFGLILNQTQCLGVKLFSLLMALLDIGTHVLSFHFVYLYAFVLLWLIRARDLPDAGLICLHRSFDTSPRVIDNLSFATEVILMCILHWL
jgi:hypothetical protein